MILQNLAEYYENLVLQEKVSKSGWCQAKVSHAIELRGKRKNGSGNLFIF